MEILCAHVSPLQTPKSLAILQRFVGPLTMERLPDGRLRCPCGVILHTTKENA